MSRVHGLYAVTPDEADTTALVAKVNAALVGGARIVQYRNKSANEKLRRAQALQLQHLCRRHAALFIINDYLDLALEIDADGLHLGGEDGSLAEARHRLRPAQLLGASCYNRLDLAHAAVRAGADHVAFGSFFMSRVKPAAVQSPLTLLAAAKRELALPIVAIGGITLANAPSLIEAGVDSIAVISDLFGAADISAAARQFNALFDVRGQENEK